MHFFLFFGYIFCVCILFTLDENSGIFYVMKTTMHSFQPLHSIMAFSFVDSCINVMKIILTYINILMWSFVLIPYFSLSFVVQVSNGPINSSSPISPSQTAQSGLVKSIPAKVPSTSTSTSTSPGKPTQPQQSTSPVSYIISISFFMQEIKYIENLTHLFLNCLLSFSRRHINIHKRSHSRRARWWRYPMASHHRPYHR